MAHHPSLLTSLLQAACLGTLGLTAAQGARQLVESSPPVDGSTGCGSFGRQCCCKRESPPQQLHEAPCLSTPEPEGSAVDVELSPLCPCSGRPTSGAGRRPSVLYWAHPLLPVFERPQLERRVHAGQQPVPQDPRGNSAGCQRSMVGGERGGAKGHAADRRFTEPLHLHTTCAQGCGEGGRCAAPPPRAGQPAASMPTCPAMAPRRRQLLISASSPPPPTAPRPPCLAPAPTAQRWWSAVASQVLCKAGWSVKSTTSFD